MPVAAIAGVVSAIAGAVGTIGTLVHQRKAAKAAKRAERARQRQMNLEAMRQKRSLLRQAMLERSKIVASAESAGIGGSSPVSGSLGSTASITAGNVGAVNQNQQIGNEIFAANYQRINAQSAANAWSGFSSLASSLFSNIGTLSRVT